MIMQLQKYNAISIGEVIMLIYGIRRKSDGKIVYVGQTVQKLRDRKLKHYSAVRCGNDAILYRAFRKYGINYFEFFIIEDGINSIDELNDLEIKYIKEYETFPCGRGCYNMTTGGKNRCEFSEEYLHKLSESQKKRYKSKESRVKHGKLMKKVFNNNPEIKNRRSKSMKKRYEDEKEREKTSKASLKMYEDYPELRQKRSEQMKNRYIENPELRKEQGIKSKTDPRYIAGRQHAHVARRKKVICLDTNEVFESIAAAAKSLGVAAPSISKAIRKQSKCKGQCFDYYKGEYND
jgi:group I intron endonuclease